MAVLFSSEDEDSVLRMTAQLLMEKNLSKADEFVIRLLVKTAEEKMQSAEEKILSIQMLAEEKMQSAEEKMLSIQMLAEEKIKTVKQEVKTLEAEKAKLLSDIQKIYVDDFITSSRGLIEYGEYWMMNKEQYKNMSRVEKWTNYLSKDPVGKRILDCILQKNKIWIKSAKDVATRIKGFYKTYSDDHHLTAHLIDEIKEFKIPESLSGVQYINMLECICDAGNITKKWVAY